MAGRLAGQLPSLPTTSPVLISGDWGAGKTTLLRAIQRRMDPDGRRTLFFEAWRYEKEALLLPALLRAIWELIPKEEREKQSAASLGARLWKTAVTVSLGTGASLAKLAGGPAGILMEALFALHKEEAEEQKKPPKGPPADLTLQLQRDFHELLASHWASEEPLIVFIDDLDRCGPEGSVGLLEALRMLLHQCTSPIGSPLTDLPCRFVVALDRKVLIHSVAFKFAGGNRYDGNRYLEKIFPFFFELPQPDGGAVHRLVSTILKASGVQSSTAAASAGAESANVDELDALATALSAPSFANPRLIKRCINRFRLILDFEKSNGAGSARVRSTHDSGDRSEILVRWIAASERWPKLRRLLASRGDDSWSQLWDVLQAHTMDSLDADLRELLQEDGVEVWMREEFLGSKGQRVAAYREADQRLRACGL